jgi:hypothetical protein
VRIGIPVEDERARETHSRMGAALGRTSSDQKIEAAVEFVLNANIANKLWRKMNLRTKMLVFLAERRAKYG